MPPWVLGVVDLVVGLALAAAGVVVLVARKERRIAVLLGAAALTWFAGSLFAPMVFLHRGPMVHLHLSYPTGRLRRWPAVAATIAAYGWALVEGSVSQPAVTAALALVMAVAAADGYLATTGPARKAGLPGFVAALLFAAILGLSAANRLLDLRADPAVAITYDAVVILVAAWLAVDLLRGRWTEATLADLVAQLGGRAPGVGLEDDLRKALGDPGLVIGYWEDAGRRYVRADGSPVEPAATGTTPVDDEDGHPLALLVHDPTLTTNPALLEGASAAARMVVSNARLRAEIRGRADALTTARRRIVEAADEQHRALQAELAAGPQARLSAARAALGGVRPELGTDVAPLVAGIEDARGELRRFALGLRPEALDSAGLPSAVAQLAERSGLTVSLSVCPDRLPPPVETAVWFVCAEALTNAAKHAGAGAVRLVVAKDGEQVVVEVSDDGKGGADPSGSGLRGLADRVAALGGTLTVTDAPDGGTLVSARIPTGGDL